MHGIKISLPIEIAICHLDWNQTWRRVRTKAIDSEHVSTLLMAIHDWLPSFQCTQLMKKIRDPDEHQCRMCGNGVESIFHIIANCVSAGAAMALLSWIRRLVSDTTIFDVLYLNVALRPGSKEETAVSILTALSIHHIWLSRNKGGMSARELKAETMGYCSLLQKN